MKSYHSFKFFAAIAVVIFCMAGVPVFAARPASEQSNVDTSRADSAQDVQTSAAIALSGARLKACEKRENTVNNIMQRTAARGEKQMGVFDKIAQRTQDFYANKKLSLSNYDALVADVNAQKAAAQAALDDIKSSSVTFKCDGSDPKGSAAAFKDKLKDETAALKAYKTSIKNLIVGVKSVAGSSSSSSTGDSQ